MDKNLEKEVPMVKNSSKNISRTVNHLQIIEKYMINLKEQLVYNKTIITFL